MTQEAPILACQAMSCQIAAHPQPLKVLQNIDFVVRRRTALGIVGESGAGKSMLVKSIMGIAPASVRVHGRIMLDNQDLFAMKPRERARFIGRKVGIVFQNPMTSLNPYVPIGRQIAEACQQHFDVPRDEARQRAIELLRTVGIADPEDCYDYYPHHFSGGMKQRIMIAASLICHPDLLIADEATTALDVTVQKEVLDLLQTIQERRQMSMILVSHNLGVVAGRTDEILVLYGGHVVEYGPTSEVFRNPRHRYTEALLSAMPQMDQPAHTRLHTIPGQPPSLANQPAGCPFAPRCGAAEGLCHTTMPDMRTGANDRHRFACHFQLDQTAGAAPVASAKAEGDRARD